MRKELENCFMVNRRREEIDCCWFMRLNNLLNVSLKFNFGFGTAQNEVLMKEETTRT